MEMTVWQLLIGIAFSIYIGVLIVKWIKHK